MNMNRRELIRNISLESFLREIEARFILLPISGRACVRALELPAAYSKDPADRIIGATALVEGLSLVAADPTVAGASHNLVRPCSETCAVSFHMDRQQKVRKSPSRP